MAKSVSGRITPIKSRAYKAMLKENFRDKTPDYVDNEKSKDNIYSQRPPDLNDLLIQQKEETGRTVRKDGRVAYAGIITFSTEAQDDIRSLNKDEQKQIYAEMVLAISKKANSDLLYITIHNDESAPHCHFMLKPYDKQGKALKLQPKDMSEIQDVLGKVLENKGFDIHRGKPKAERIAAGEPRSAYIHKTVRELHKTLPEDLERKKAEVNELIETKSRLDEEFTKVITEMEKIQDEQLDTIEELNKSIEQKRIEAKESEDKYLKYNRLAEINREKLEAGIGNIEKIGKNLEIYERRSATAKEQFDALTKGIKDVEKTMARIDQTLPAVENVNLPVKQLTVLLENKLFSTTTKEVSVVLPEDAERFKQAVNSTYSEREQILKDQLATYEWENTKNGKGFEKWLESKQRADETADLLRREVFQLRQKLEKYEPETQKPEIQNGKSVSREQPDQPDYLSVIDEIRNSEKEAVEQTTRRKSGLSLSR